MPAFYYWGASRFLPHFNDVRTQPGRRHCVHFGRFFVDCFAQPSHDDILHALLPTSRRVRDQMALRRKDGRSGTSKRRDYVCEPVGGARRIASPAVPIGSGSIDAGAG